MAGPLLPMLPIELEEQIVGLLSPNEIFCTVRLVNKAAAAHYPGPDQRPTVHLSQPVPHHAFSRRCTEAWTRTLSFRLRVKLLCLTASSGHVVNLEVAVGAAGCMLRKEVMNAAAAAGHVHVCLWLRQRDCSSRGALESASAAGRWQVCEWLLAHGCLRDAEHLRDAAWAAARRGHLGLAEWLRQQLPPGEMTADPVLVGAVAHGGDLVALQRYYSAWRETQRQHRAQEQAGVHADDQQQQQQQQQHAEEEEDFMNGRAKILAMACGSPTPDWVAKVGWLEAQGCPRFRWAALSAALMPDEAAVVRLRWLRERGYPLEEEAVEAADLAGNVATLEYLLEEAGVEVASNAEDLSVVAARTGNLAALRRRHASGRTVDPAGCLSAAADNGQQQIVEWLVDTFGLTAADMQEHAADDAVVSGSVELVDWLAGRGCDFSKEDDILTSAADGGCEAVLERLVELGCRMPDDGKPYHDPVRNGDLATLRCLRRLGCPWGPGDLVASALRGPGVSRLMLPALRWLVEAGCPVNWAEALEAARQAQHIEDRSEVVTWLEEGLGRSEAGGLG